MKSSEPPSADLEFAPWWYDPNGKDIFAAFDADGRLVDAVGRRGVTRMIYYVDPTNCAWPYYMVWKNRDYMAQKDFKEPAVLHLLAPGWEVRFVELSEEEKQQERW